MLKCSIKLNADSIEKAIKDIQAYQKKTERAGAKLTNKLTEQGVSLAQQNASYMNVYDSGELVNGIDSMYGNGKGYVVSNAAHSAFCEFGTGAVGKGSQHPEPMPGWVYDVNEHGESGWWYYNDQGERRWTKGMPSRPYMYDTARMLRNMIVSMAKEEFK